MTGTKLFQRNRALGYVSNHITASVRYIRKRKENVIITCVGRAFHTYSSNQFRLICVSGLHPDEITCITADHLHVYTASERNVYAWRSGNVIKHVYKGHKQNVHLLLILGKHLISIDKANVLKIWDIQTEDIYLDLPFKANEFNISAIMHPATYINKILLGSEQGILQLWNVRDSKLVHTFKPFDGHILILEQAPALDVAAVGLENGAIILLNLKLDEIIMKFSQDWGPVSGISFRTDGHPIMVTSSTNGKIVFWNLEEKKVVSQIKAHSGSVTTTHCFPSEPLMLTTSPDNSMKLWIFDMLDGGARLLKIREGHTKPPTSIRFHGANGQNILSAGEDATLRIFNTVVDQLNRSLGTASFNRKASKKLNRFQKDIHRMPPIKQFTSEITRDKEWDCIAAIHNNVLQTTTWSYYKSKMGDLKLVPDKFQKKHLKNFNVHATCLCLSHCGNFVIIGYSSGDVVRFNIQSGLERDNYVNPTHDNSAVRGISTDNLNQLVVAGYGDGLINFWKFKLTNKNKQPLNTLRMDAGILMFETHRESAMICVVLDNYTCNLIDIDSKTIVRRFSGHKAQITDVCFSPDSRWLITAALDCTIKVWDIPSSYLIDHFQIENACTSMCMSPTGQFLATTHVNFVGVYLWSNKTLYSHIALRSLNPESEAPLVNLHQSMFEEVINVNDKELVEGEDLENNYKSPIQLDSILITMSSFAASKWQNLLNLDIIKKRNKPKVPLKKPKQAPFFLPTLSGPEIKFDFSNEQIDEENSKIISTSNFENLTNFGKMLKLTKKTNEFQPCIDYLLSLGPSMIDADIKMLSADNSGSILIMKQFLHLIIQMFKSKINFELAQAYLSVYLKTHADEITKTDKLRVLLNDVEEAQNVSWNNLESKLLYGIGVVNTLRNFVS